MSQLRHAPHEVVAAAVPPTLWFGRGCTPVVVRPLHPDDAGAFGDFVHALSPASRRSRFHASVRDLPPSWLQALTQRSSGPGWALVAMALDGRQPRCVAEARYVVDDTEPRRGEFALAVADVWQGQGLASELLRRLCDHAARHGLRSLFGDVLHDNLPMLGLARRQGFAILAHPADPRLRRVVRRLDASVHADETVAVDSTPPRADGRRFHA